MHRAFGADVVGMTALPEARLAQEAEMAHALIALPTDHDCWRPPRGAASERGADESLLAESFGNIRRSAEGALRLIECALTDLSILLDRPAASHDALRLAIWTPKKLPLGHRKHAGGVSGILPSGPPLTDAA
jgi:5'-methylthioadenosine phosphorylase